MFSLMSAAVGKAPIDWRGEAWLDIAETAVDEGFLFVVDGATMEPVADVLRFLMDGMRFRKLSIATERAFAADLYEWLLYRRASDRDLSDTTAEDLADYRDRLLTSISPKTGKPLASSTVRRRLSSIISFYGWADREGVIPNEVGRKSIRLRPAKNSREWDMLAHLGSTPSETNVLLPKVQAHLPEFIEESALRRILDEVGSAPLKKDGRPGRDWLIVFLSLLTGMRRKEVAGLTVRQFQGLMPTEDRPARLLLSVTKGSRRRSVPIETFTLDQVTAYIEGERREVLTAARRNDKFRSAEPTALFLNGPHCAVKYLGNPITEDMIDRMFLRAQRKVFGEDAAGHTFHHLRHTHVMQRRLAGDEWDNISRDLGHAQIATTINTYARASNRMEADTRARFVNTLRRLAESE